MVVTYIILGAIICLFVALLLRLLIGFMKTPGSLGTIEKELKEERKSEIGKIEKELREERKKELEKDKLQ